jgi:hypothetical protein
MTGPPSLECILAEQRRAKRQSPARGSAPPTPERGPWCECAWPARSPRAVGWFCQTCKRPGPPGGEAA